MWHDSSSSRVSRAASGCAGTDECHTSDKCSIAPGREQQMTRTARDHRIRIPRLSLHGERVRARSGDD